MSRGKTDYTFTINADPALINQVICNFLQANEFMPVPKPNANYYYFNDPLVKGKRSFEYYINGNTVTILAYLGKFEKPVKLEGFVACVPKHAYQNDLNVLFNELKKLEQVGNNYQMPAGSAAPQNNYGNYAGAVQTPDATVFMEQNNSKKETWTMVGFVMSLIGVFLAFFGFVYGWILLFLEVYCGVQGLGTRKKGFAIATIVLAAASLVIFVLNLVMMYA